jgi:hypothetical protein
MLILHLPTSSILSNFPGESNILIMIFNFASAISAVVLALPLTSVLANPLPAKLENQSTELEERGNWGYPKTHRVTVGAWGKLMYDPEYVNAKFGDYVKFELYVYLAILPEFEQRELT